MLFDYYKIVFVLFDRKWFSSLNYEKPLSVWFIVWLIFSFIDLTFIAYIAFYLWKKNNKNVIIAVQWFHINKRVVLIDCNIVIEVLLLKSAFMFKMGNGEISSKNPLSICSTFSCEYEERNSLEKYVIDQRFYLFLFWWF